MIDDTDKKILDILQRDVNTPLREIGAVLNISAPAVFKRIKKMKKMGVIRRETVIIDPKTVGMDLIGFVGIAAELDKLDKIVSTLMNIKGVLGIYLITGEFDILIKVIARDMKSFRDVVIHKINEIDGVVRTTTMISFETKKDTNYIPLL